jgi:hypothetical protein
MVEILLPEDGEHRENALFEKHKHRFGFVQAIHCHWIQFTHWRRRVTNNEKEEQKEHSKERKRK